MHTATAQNSAMPFPLSSSLSDKTVPGAEALSVPSTSNVIESNADSPAIVNPPTATSSSLIARTQIRNSFAIYDTAIIDEIAGLRGDPPAWLEVEAVVVDESNFSTQDHWRRLQLVVTDPKTGMVTKAFPRSILFPVSWSLNLQITFILRFTILSLGVSVNRDRPNRLYSCPI